MEAELGGLQFSMLEQGAIAVPHNSAMLKQERELAERVFKRKEGASVIICASREETAIKGVDKLKELHPGSVVEGIWPAVADYEAVQKAFDEIIKKYGKIDIFTTR